ncbi:hypothetical protein RR42_m2783 [Cupriavidus basilensis]|uniref:Uncharacterized protein n=1 Tax=Cupriavidus basilensis TaxID=68895 RepID=A0A0C4Y4C7_9BURK|nr:hypothetical protein RR42_m2783 [Cupriavidus basilensis]
MGRGQHGYCGCKGSQCNPSRFHRSFPLPFPFPPCRLVGVAALRQAIFELGICIP